MAQIKRFQRFEDFVSFNEGFLNENPMLYYFPIKIINQIYDGEEVEVYKFFNVIGETGKELFFLLTKDVCLIYGSGFNEEMIFKLSNEMEFKKFKRYQFAGNKNIIDSLFKLNAAEYELQKHRIIYKCKKVNTTFTYSIGQMQKADINRLDELANLGVRFNEDYFGQGYFKKKESFEDMKNIVLKGIMEENLYQWNNNNNICSIAQRIDEDSDFPVIGLFYTNPSFRNQSFGSSLIHKLTKTILDSGEEILHVVYQCINSIIK